MKRFLVGVILLCLTIAPASGAIIPYGSILSVGQWIFRDRIKFYQVQVEGTGNNFNEAKQEAFKQAVEVAVGSLLLSEYKVVDGEVKRKEIISYASGFIDKFEIISRDDTPGMSRVAMTVWVAESKIANRLLNKSTASASINTEQRSVQIASLIQERQTGDRVLETVLGDFPHRAFDITSIGHKISLNNKREPELEIVFSINWNHLYLKSLWESLVRVSQEPKSCLGDIWSWFETTPSKCLREQKYQSSVSMSYKGGDLFGWTGKAFYADASKAYAIQTRMVGQAPSVLIEMQDDTETTLEKFCWYSPELDNDDSRGNIPNTRIVTFQNQSAHINGNWKKTAGIIANYKNRQDILSKISKIQVSVVSGTTCHK